MLKKLVNAHLFLLFLIPLNQKGQNHFRLIDHIKIFINLKNFTIQEYIEQTIFIFLFLYIYLYISSNYMINK